MKTSRHIWRSIERLIQRREGRIRISQLERWYKLPRWTLRRGLRQRHIRVEPASYPWEAGSRSGKKDHIQKCSQALALYFLSVKVSQIPRFIRIKSKTVRTYILRMTRESGLRSRPDRMFREDALESLAGHLERAYGLGEHFEEIEYECSGHWFPPQVFRQFPFQRPSHFLIHKLRRILKRDVYRKGLSICAVGLNGRPVRIGRLTDVDARLKKLRRQNWGALA